MDVRIISQRTHALGQGFELQRVWHVHVGPEAPWGHRLRTTVCRANTDGGTYGEVSRWDGTRWHEVVTLPYDALTHGPRGKAPSYACWVREDRAVNGREDCDEWLRRVAEQLEAAALEVVDPYVEIGGAR